MSPAAVAEGAEESSPRRIFDESLHFLLAPRTAYDIYIRRDRVIMYVNGEQRLCNDFPSVALTMAEGALGYGQVLYHSSAERLEFSRGYNDRTGQLYYLSNTPFVDVRTWDNVGYQEGVGSPADFDDSVCYLFDREVQATP